MNIAIQLKEKNQESQLKQSGNNNKSLYKAENNPLASFFFNKHTFLTRINSLANQQKQDIKELSPFL
jgi:hypothetical protein